ncbi:hypothetical protein TRAPUB_1483 [Trametes pubescens]|uniref:Uncharacterized protein n=1 Tax=Trametes pubescens TaxID=154538 RepID=A0A1M2VJB6_TRAPU|nr:hypothetical protein TRAPUB_1483 [Trametes pubescens]
MSTSTISKKITIKGGTLGGVPCSLTLAFVPKDGKADFKTVYPLAWKVITRLNDNASFTYDWNNFFGASRVVTDPDTATAEADEYTPLAVNRTTDLLLDDKRRPPEFYFSDPTTYSQPTARVMNRTGQYVDIGAGYITNLDDPSEAMNTVLVVRRVVDQSPAYVDYIPTLKIWASLDYTQSQLLDSSVNNITPLWEGTLTELTGKQITITIDRDSKGKLVAKDSSSLAGAAAKSSFLKQLSANFDRPYTYSVVLAFAHPALVTDGVQSISGALSAQGYFSKTVQKGFDYEARLELTLPVGFSCNKAELDMIAAIDANPTIHGKAFIKSHSGAALISANNGLETWIEINPASRQWFDIDSEQVRTLDVAGLGALSSQYTQGENAAFNGANEESFTKASAAEVNGSGANGSADPVAIKAVRRKGNAAPSDGNGSVNNGDSAEVPDDETKFRSVRRSGGGRRALAA